MERRQSMPSGAKSSTRRSSFSRRVSADMGGGCTILPALSSVDNLFHDSAKADDEEFEIEDLENMGMNVLNGKQPKGKVSPHGRLQLSQVLTTWYIVLSGRTFQGKTVDHVISALIKHLGMDPTVAQKTACAAQHSKTMILETCKSCSDACLKAEFLRGSGLHVLVTSKTGLPGAPSSSSDAPSSSSEMVPTKPKGEKPSYSDVFRRASAERVPSKIPSRRPSTCARPSTTPANNAVSLESTLVKVEVLAEDAVEALFRHDAQTAQGAQAQTTRRPSEQSELDAQSCNSTSSAKGQLREVILRNKDKILAAAQGRALNGALGTQCKREKTLSMWDDLINAVQTEVIDTKTTPARKEACEIGRFLVFGEMCLTKSERDRKYMLSKGTKEDIRILVPFWSAMDADKSGRVDLGEFQRYADARMRWRFSELDGDANVAAWARHDPWEDLGKLISKLRDSLILHLFGKKGSMGIDDFFRLLWLRATVNDLRDMKLMCKEIAKEPGMTYMAAPPVLSSTEYEDLCTIFRHFDTERKGFLTFEQLIAVGLLYPDQEAQTRREWDSDGNGTIDVQEFCEMMCPTGYRAHSSSLVGTIKDGSRVVYDKSISHWLLEREMEKSRGTGIDSSTDDATQE